MSDRFEKLEQAVMDARVRVGLLAIGNEELGKDFREAQQEIIEFARTMQERMKRMSERCEENALVSRGIISNLSEQADVIRELGEESRTLAEQVAENRARIEQLEAS